MADSSMCCLVQISGIYRGVQHLSHGQQNRGYDSLAALEVRINLSVLTALLSLPSGCFSLDSISFSHMLTLI